MLIPHAEAPEYVIGRDSSATLRLLDSRVSRKHAQLTRTNAGWHVKDLGSRSGTLVDGRPLLPDESVLLSPGSALSVGPFQLRLMSGARSLMAVPLLDDSAQSLASAVSKAELGALAAHRLHVLLELAGQLHRSTDITDALERVAQALRSGTRYGRALILRDGSSGQERVAESTVNQQVCMAPISRTLLAAARSSRAPVRLEDRGDLRGAASIMHSGVSSALCIPIIPATDDALSVQMVAYLDSPSGSSPPAEDAAAFAHAACDLASMAIESEERRSLQSDVNAMHQVQVNMMPPALIQAADLQVITRCIPGSGAAGDIVGYCPTANGGHVLIVGDVSGKGPAAAMLMASVVSHLHASLSLHNDLPDAVARLNNHVQERFRGERFVTAAFVHLPSDGTVHVMDAGHALIAHVTATGVPTLLELPGGPPLGVVQEQVYEVGATAVGVGDRLVIFTDGVTEQRSPAGHMFRIEGVMTALQGSQSAHDDVTRLTDHLRNYAGKPTFDDDVTIVSIERRATCS